MGHVLSPFPAYMFDRLTPEQKYEFYLKERARLVRMSGCEYPPPVPPPWDKAAQEDWARRYGGFRAAERSGAIAGALTALGMFLLVLAISAVITWLI